jgi:hypothetical protein
MHDSGAPGSIRHLPQPERSLLVKSQGCDGNQDAVYDKIKFDCCGGSIWTKL